MTIVVVVVIVPCNPYRTSAVSEGSVEMNGGSGWEGEGGACER